MRHAPPQIKALLSRCDDDDPVEETKAQMLERQSKEGNNPNGSWASNKGVAFEDVSIEYYSDGDGGDVFYSASAEPLFEAPEPEHSGLSIPIPCFTTNNPTPSGHWTAGGSSGKGLRAHSS